MKRITAGCLLVVSVLHSHAFAVGKPATVAGGGQEDLLYVSTAGNDAWSGTLAGPNAARSDGPLASLDKARLAVRARIDKGLSKPFAVLIRGGEYTLDATVVFGPEDAGTKACPIAYRAYPGEKPVFTGAKRLIDWKPCTSDPAGLPTAAKGKLWVAEIPAALKGSWQVTTLYDGLTLLPRSRSGAFKAADVTQPDDCNDEPKSVLKKLKPTDAPVTFSREFHFLGEDLKAWANPGDIEIFLRPWHGWLINLLPLERIDAATKTARVAIDPTYRVQPGNTYQVDNAIEYLDEPGEWVFRSDEGRLYLWPKQAPALSDIRAPFLQEFIRVEGVEDKTPVRFLGFSGLTFHHGLRDTWRQGDKGLQHDWEMYDKGNAVLRFRHADECAIDGCTFTSSSGGGVRLDLYCQRITVANSLFSNLGGPGIVLSGYGPGTKDENKNNTITNNTIHHVGAIYLHSPGIFIAQSGHNLISHNTIHDLHYNGMVISGCRPHEFVLAKPLANRREWVSSIRMAEAKPYIDKLIARNITDWQAFDINEIEPLLHARENRIEDNEIYRTMLTLHDGNGVYFSAMGKNNRLEHNFIHDINNSNGSIRLDDNPTFTVMNYNVIANGNNMCIIKGPAEMRNNFAIEMGSYINIKTPDKTGRFEGLVLDRNVFYSANPQNRAFEDVGKRDRKYRPTHSNFSYSENSLLFSATAPNWATGEKAMFPTRKRNSAVGLLFADPLFDQEAMKQKLFRFKPGSPTEKLGIKPLDMSKAGATLAEK